MTRFDAILIPGGGVGPGYSLPPWSEARFDHALARASGQETFVCLSVATPHLPPPLDSKGFPIRECEAGARYLLARGIPAERIRMEAISLDTVGNAWFAKLLHVDPAGWRNLLVVTSEFHMPRTRTIFETVFGFESDKYQLTFETSENRGLTPEAVAAREAREAAGGRSFLAQMQAVHNLNEFDRWIYLRHLAYAVSGIDSPHPDLDPATARSYGAA